jgi:hypothetical protein
LKKYHQNIFSCFLPQTTPGRGHRNTVFGLFNLNSILKQIHCPSVASEKLRFAVRAEQGKFAAIFNTGGRPAKFNRLQNNK